MITASDLKRSRWSNTMHADGSDKAGRFFINFFKCDAHPRLTGSRKQWRRKDVENEVAYFVDGEEVASLDVAADMLNRVPVTAGDDKEARDD